MVMNKRKGFRALVAALPLVGQRLAWVDFRHGGSSDDDVQDKAVTMDAPVEEANVMTSLVDVGSRDVEEYLDVHRPVIDIDHAVRVIPSSTGGHSHLFIDVTLTWGDYLKLLDVLVEIGIVQPGYVNASRARGYTAVRLPWVSKHEVTDAEVAGQ